MKRLVLFIMLWPTLMFGMDRITALSMIETGHNDRMVGRAGEISRYQILKQEWSAVTQSHEYTNPVLAKEVALKILDKRVAKFRTVYRRDPSDFEFYALWNAPAQVLRNKVSRTVAERCNRFANLCSISKTPT